MGSREPGVDQLVQSAVLSGFHGLDIADQHFVPAVGVALASLFATGIEP